MRGVQPGLFTNGPGAPGRFVLLERYFLATAENCSAVTICASGEATGIGHTQHSFANMPSISNVSSGHPPR